MRKLTVVGRFSISRVANRFVWICMGCMVRLLMVLGMLCGQNLVV